MLPSPFVGNNPEQQVARKELARLIQEGYSNRFIAEVFRVHPMTIETWRRRVRAEAYMREGQPFHFVARSGRITCLRCGTELGPKDRIPHCPPP